MHSAVAVANNFIARGLVNRTLDLSPTKLHELVYLAHGWHLGLTNQPLINGSVAAFRDGIMIPELRMRGFWGTRRVEDLLSVFDPSRTGSGMMKNYIPEVPKNDPVQKTLEWIWTLYGRMSPYELTNLTRQAGAPWATVWNHPQRIREEPYDIPQQLLQKWFTAEVKLHQQRSRNAAVQGESGERAKTEKEAAETAAARTLNNPRQGLRPL